MAGARIIAQALPDPEDFLLICRGQVPQGRIGGHEAVEVGYDGGDLGLLEHGLGNEHAIGIRSFGGW